MKPNIFHKTHESRMLYQLAFRSPRFRAGTATRRGSFITNGELSKRINLQQ
jgi:hypothetical protein